MLVEAVEIIRSCSRRLRRHEGRHFQLESAKLWDLPEQPPPIGIAMSGRPLRLAGELADLVIAVEPEAELLPPSPTGGAGKPSYGQVPVSYDTDERRPGARAHEQFRWFSGGWKVNAELPGTAGFAGASRW